MDKKKVVEVPVEGPDAILDAVSPLVRAAYKMKADLTELKFSCEGERYKVTVKRIPKEKPL